jgi:hypothetical protein
VRDGEAPELLEAVTEERMTAAEGIVKTASPRSSASSAGMAPPPPHPGLIVRELISGREVGISPRSVRASPYLVQLDLFRNLAGMPLDSPHAGD